MLAGYFHLDTAHRHLSISVAEYMELEKCRADNRALSSLCSSHVQCTACTAVYSSSPAHLCRLNPLYYPENRCYSLSVQFSCSVMSDSLRPHRLQHARLPCSSPTPGAYSNSCPLSWWCHPTISSSVVPFSSCLQSFSGSGVFSNESTLRIRWPKYWSFSFNISPSNEYSGLISFRMNLLDFLAVQGTLKSLLQHHSSKASILRLS